MGEGGRRGLGLRGKFTALILFMAVLLVLATSVTLGGAMLGWQKRASAESLARRVDALMGAMSSLAAESIRGYDAAGLILLQDLAKSLPEAEYITLTGPGLNDSGRFDYLWFSSDPEISTKLAGGTFHHDKFGEVRLVDDVSAELERLASEMNTAARARSFPALDPQRLLERYLFYLPVAFRQDGEDAFFRGAVRLGVSTDAISRDLSSSLRRLLIQTALIAGLALGGAIIMAGIVVGPIRRLASGVAVIRDTANKEDLQAHRIEVRSRDEIGSLADTVNDMTQGLVKAAIAEKELLIAKDIQRRFLPLSQDYRGGTGNEYRDESGLAELFGYSQGCRSLSGDFFDCRTLDDSHQALIMCDISGKGASAALIMVEVASLFTSACQDWNGKEFTGRKLAMLAERINGRLESRGFPGRFAVLTLGILDLQTGETTLCACGEKQVCVYRQSKKQVVRYALPDSPAAGVFSSELVEMKGGFKPVRLQLAQGDALFLFTDGIEDGLGEAARIMNIAVERQAATPKPIKKDRKPFHPKRIGAPFHRQLSELARQDPALAAEFGLEDGPAGSPGEVTQVMKGKESGEPQAPGAQMEEGPGMERICAVIDAALNRRPLRLSGHRNPLLEPELEFDFTACSGSVEEAVLALVSVEKLMRLQPAADAAEKDRVNVDRRVDAFLSKHYGQYGRYFTRKLEAADGGELVSFTHLREDPQYDDLTILAIRKK